MNSGRKIIFVYSGWHSGQPPRQMGELRVQSIRGKEICSFEFNREWIKNNPAYSIDPDLQFFGGPQYPHDERANFGLFLDSSPDRWGRQLMRRREAILARKEERPTRILQESDYLLGVFDQTRMGALRFKLDQNGEFLNHDQTFSAPPWTSLRELESACRNYENETRDDSEHEKWISMLLAPGSSLGGARPKANVTAPDNQLWIAKFPSRNDSRDIAAWEMVAHQMAADAGLNVPEARLDKFSKFGSTFLSRRFDRMGEQRIHFASAMTLLGKTDGADSQDGSSYLDLVPFIMRQSAAPDKDLAELWRRILFSIAIKNTDDHLRNHGFLLTEQGWRLSPAYDINPNPDGLGLSLNITESDNSLDFDLARNISPYFRISDKQATETICQIRKVVSQWRNYARRYKLSVAEQDFMSPAFSLQQ